MDWLGLAKDAYEASTSYVDANYRKRWEDAIAQFNNRHPADSKYNQDSYKHRSRLFRPKARAMVRKYEAAAAAAFFANIDVVSTTAVRESDMMQRAGAELMKEILQHRLTKTIPWFQVLVGGVQDALTVGVVCSYQYWKHSSKPVKVIGERPELSIGEDGNEVVVNVPEERIEMESVIDEPCVELVPIENIRIDPAADWIDPIKSSPYAIRMVPMYAVDLKTEMRRIDQKTGRARFNQLDDGQIAEGVKTEADSTKAARDGGRQQTEDSEKSLADYEVIWLHENFVRVEGEEFVFWTLGTKHMLSEPVPLADAYFHGERPLVMGCAVLETHRTMPNSMVMLGDQLLREANEIVNQRLDNVKLVLNKRWIVKRGKNVDVNSLLRNVPGSVTMADATDDVQEINWPDVTGSSFAEQDRVNVDYDELTGSFSAGSVQSNRKLNETVGGMSIISSSASQITEFTLRTITETWVEKVLRQLVKLESAYETDEVILGLAAERAQLYPRYGIDKVTDKLLQQDLSVNVNVGIGATDPGIKLNRFLMAMDAYSRMSQSAPQNVDLKEVAKEVFGLSGYRDGARFFSEEDPRMQAMQNQLQQEGQRLSQMAQDAQAEIAQKEAELDAYAKELKAREAEIQAKEAEVRAKAANVQVKDTLADAALHSASNPPMQPMPVAQQDPAIGQLAEQVADLMASLQASPQQAQSAPVVVQVTPGARVKRGQAIRNPDGSWSMVSEEVEEA